VIAIEAFPLNITNHLPDNATRDITSSGKCGEESFATIFSSRTSEGSSTLSQSKRDEKVGRFEKVKEGSAQANDDYDPTVGVNGQVLTYGDAHAQPQLSSDFSQGSLNQNPELGIHKTGLYGEKGIQPSSMDILLQLGFTQEEIDGLAGAKDLGSLEAVLLKLGLPLSEGGQFIEGDPNGIKGEGEALLNKLMSLLEDKGVPPHKLSEMREMLMELKVESLKIDGAVTGAKQLPHEIRNLLLSLGVHPEEAEKLVAGDGIDLDRLSTILLKLGMRLEEVGNLVRAGEGQVNGLKNALIKAGINPEEVNKLLALGGQQGKNISLKELISFLNKNIQDFPKGDVTGLSAKEEPSLGDKATSPHNQGEVDLSGREHSDSNTIISKEVEGGKSRIDFEQVMTKAELRASTPQKVMEQVVKVTKLQIVNGQTRASISLQPPSLGKLHMHIITENNQVRATFFAETSQVKEIIESNLPQLRESFQQQGLKVEHFNVFVGSHPGENQTEKQGFFDAGTSPRLEGEGQDGEDGPMMEITRKRALGNHMVDLFV
jgi:hypothetical protein